MGIWEVKCKWRNLWKKWWLYGLVLGGNDIWYEASVEWLLAGRSQSTHNREEPFQCHSAHYELHITFSWIKFKLLWLESGTVAFIWMSQFFITLLFVHVMLWTPICASQDAFNFLLNKICLNPVLSESTNVKVWICNTRKKP